MSSKGHASTRPGHASTGPDDEVVCPHCNKPFSAALLGGAAERYRGFKCPHCRLFVPAGRAGS